MTTHGHGPGLRKARLLPLVEMRPVVQVRGNDHPLRELLARADSVSEGSARKEGSDTVWYGTTSLVLALPHLSPAELEGVRAVASRDVHLRTRALRMAHREASLRAPGNLGRLSCEIRFADAPGALRIDVDVQAPLIGGRHARVP